MKEIIPFHTTLSIFLLVRGPAWSLSFITGYLLFFFSWHFQFWRKGVQLTTPSLNCPSLCTRWVCGAKGILEISLQEESKKFPWKTWKQSWAFVLFFVESLDWMTATLFEMSVPSSWPLFINCIWHCRVLICEYVLDIEETTSFMLCWSYWMQDSKAAGCSSHVEFRYGW